MKAVPFPHKTQSEGSKYLPMQMHTKLWSKKKQQKLFDLQIQEDIQAVVELGGLS